jgi:hypothetical protein
MNKQDFTDEEDLYSDIGTVGEEGAEDLLPGDPPVNTDLDSDPLPEDEGSTSPDLDNDIELTGVEMFLTNYGVKGGMIDFEEGEATHFNDLDSETQNTVLRSLTEKSIPTIEDAYNLNGSEIDLINDFRNSGEENAGEYFNNAISSRVTDFKNNEKYGLVKYDEYDNDDIFLYNLKRDNTDMTDDELADELIKARESNAYGTTVSAMRENLKNEQKVYLDDVLEVEGKEFENELENQRQNIVDDIVDINDIGGAPISNEMKEFLLGDIMELNENEDPILMEKIFSDPKTMFEVNWYMNYGKDYIENLNTYWKGEVSKAHKSGKNEVVRKMPGKPTVSTIPQQRNTASRVTEGTTDIMTEDEFFS